jgi:hypothetical protein
VNETRSITAPLAEAINAIPGCKAYRILCGTVPTKGGWIHGAEEGTPDLMCSILGRTVYHETKTPIGKLSDVQKRRHAELAAAGNLVFVPRSALEGIRLTRGVFEQEQRKRRSG